MTATVTPSTRAISEWVKVFPKQATENYTSSVTFMKQLTVVAVSTITYLKNAFPEDSYMVETFGGVKLRVLKKKCRNELAQFLSTALTQAFEAFEKKFLHQLALCFYEEECKLENLIEYHIFEYSYNDDGVTMNVHSKNRDNVQHTMKYSFENVRERTIHLIRACVVIMQSCQNDLPSSYDVSLRLYYNQDAPEDYQAPGFLCTNELEDHLEHTLLDAIKLGWVETPYHKLIARSFIKEHLEASREAIPSQNRPVLSNEVQLSGSKTGESEIKIVCPCNNYGDETYDTNELLLCRQCHTYQHACCFGVLATGAERASTGAGRVATGAGRVAAGGGRVAAHCCARCSDAGCGASSDRALQPLSDKKRECLCIFRRTLEWCTMIPSIDPGSLVQKFRISHSNADKLMKLLHSHGVVAQETTETNASQIILPDQLKSVMAKFFNYQNEHIVDRLLAETFQESAPDPIGEVIGPLEKVSLQNASNIGRVITKPPNPTNEDATLKQYREALLSDVTEEPFGDFENVKKCTKRKMSDGEKPPLRRGVRTKRARAMPE